ncbi:MAG: lipoyl protein ligase domain-containing protein [Acidimicrobiales bacterium]
MKDRAIILGSAQAGSDVDTVRCQELGVSVVRRRSGGGAVYVAPEAQVWIDVFLPSGDPLLHADLGRSFLWFGHVWAEALGSVIAGPNKPEKVARLATEAIAVARPGLKPSEWSRRLCFASLGAGEVTVQGKKVVGLSQRRDRSGAWLYSMALLADTSKALVDCLDLTLDERSRALGCLREHAGTVPASGELLVDAVFSSLP